CSRTPPRADAKRKRADAPSFCHRRTSLRHAQMPRRLSPLPRSRLQQGARRMEPDGALLQLYPRAQYPRLRGLRCVHGQGASIAPTRLWSSHRRPPVRAREIFGTHHALVHTPSTPTAFAGLIAAFLPSLVGQINSDLQKSCQAPKSKIFRFTILKIRIITSPIPAHKRGVSRSSRCVGPE